MCPVDCFYEGENMLVIHPDECIDCGVCEPECPVNAIKADSEPGLEKWLLLNAEYAKIWPNITVKKSATARLEGVGGEAGQTSIFFTQAWNRRLNDSLSTIPPWPVTRGRTVSGVEFLKRISNTKASRTAAETANPLQPELS